MASTTIPDGVYCYYYPINQNRSFCDLARILTNSTMLLLLLVVVVVVEVLLVL